MSALVEADFQDAIRYGDDEADKLSNSFQLRLTLNAISYRLLFAAKQF